MTNYRKYRIAAFAALLSPALSAQTAVAEASGIAPEEPDEDVVVLSPFEVSSDSDRGYVATQTLAGSRINTKLSDVGSAISVVTSEFLKDTGATDNKTLLSYTTNTEVGGTQGNFKGISGSQSEDEGGRLTNPNGNTRVRGLTYADNTRNFFGSSIPWDGYNIDRVDMQRGANSILFGLGSPAGIINTTTKSAQHRNFGEIEIRVGAFGANRQSIDINQVILRDELSIRVAALRNDEKFKQTPAYSLDRRIFGTLRYDPKFLGRDGRKTTVKLNFENGTVRSNNPRTLTPTDHVTPWWSQLDRQGYDPNRVQDSGRFYEVANGVPVLDGSGNQVYYYPGDAGQYNSARSPSGANPTFEPWLGAPSFYGGVWMPVGAGTVSPSAFLQPEYRTVGGLRSTGAIDGSIGGLPFSRRVTIATTAYLAERDPSLPYRSWGVWKSTTLSDPSVFDFYNNLLDGENKKEWQNFKNFSASLTQTFFHEKLGFEAAYSIEQYRSGRYSHGGGDLFVDINTHLIGGAVNPNYGKPYIESSYTWGNGESANTLESSRLSAFFDHDFNKDRNGGWLRKLLGRHTLSALYSQDMARNDSRSYKRYGTDDSFGALVALNPATADVRYLTSNDRAVTSTIYLSDVSLATAATSAGVHIPRAQGSVEIPATVPFRFFDGTWNATSVNPGDEWINSYNGQLTTQSENPENYVGWRTTDVRILSAENGDKGALTFGANLNRRKVDSRAAVWQAYFWDGAIIGMYGIRHDNVKSWAYTATRVNDRVDLAAIAADGHPQYSTVGRDHGLYRANSPSWSVVAKLNKLLGRHGDLLPLNVSLFYNESRNFQVAGTRNDIYGNPLPAPSGETNDRGIMLSTKDDRFMLKINKYETTVMNSGNSVLNNYTWFLLGGGNFIMRNEDRADAYEYHLTSVGDPNSVADTGTVTGTWTWRYTPRTDQTQEQADAEAAAAVAAWRQYTNEPIVKRILQAWGFNDFSGIAPTTMSTPVSNFTATEDQISKGWEYELTANPTKNWRITVNASDTKAQRNNVGGAALQEFVELTNRYQNGPMGDIRQWGGGQNSLPPAGLNSWNGNFYSKYALMRLQEGTNTPEIRQWRVNVITNYSFTEGRLKGFNIGGGYRWEDKIAIGYPVLENEDKTVTFDIGNPYYGPASSHVDLWVGYERKLTSKIDWRVQLNIRNLFDGNELVPLTTQYDGTVATWGIAPCRTWTLTNTFRF